VSRARPRQIDVAVIGIPDERWGQRLHAFVVKRPRSKLSEDGVRDHVRSRLARFKVPRGVTFIDELPRNATGKVVKRDLEVPRKKRAASVPRGH
jgi:fatty-acyl-CoA synthase